MKRIEYTVVLEVENPYDLEWMESDITSWVHEIFHRLNVSRQLGATITGTSIATIGES